eukprot:666895_1
MESSIIKAECTDFGNDGHFAVRGSSENKENLLKSQQNMMNLPLFKNEFAKADHRDLTEPIDTGISPPLGIQPPSVLLMRVNPKSEIDMGSDGPSIPNRSQFVSDSLEPVAQSVSHVGDLQTNSKPQSIALSNPTSTRHTKQKYKIQCTKCETDFKTYLLFSKHMLDVHSNPKPFQCH